MFALPPPSELIWKHVWVTKKGERKDKIQLPKLKINRNCTYRKRAGELYRGSFKRLWPHGLEVALCVWETETEERWFRKSANFESSEQTFPAQKAAKDRVLIEFNSYFFNSCMKIYNFHIKHIQIVYFILYVCKIQMMCVWINIKLHGIKTQQYKNIHSVEFFPHF